MSKAHHFFKFFKKHKLLTAGAAIAILGAAFFAGGRGTKAVETAQIVNEDLVRTVKISGKVSPSERADLAFEVSGTVAGVGKPVGSKTYKGEVLARLDAGAASADLSKALADLSSAQAELNKVQGAGTYENTITNSKRSVVQSIKDAYTAASDAIQNKADQVFVDPRSSRPEIAGSFDGYNDLRSSLSSTRVEMGYMMESWKELVNSLGADSYTESQLSLSKSYLAKADSFITNVSLAVNMFKETSFMSQTQIDAYKAAMLSAREKINQASQGFIASENELSSTLSDVPVQLARVEAARATVENLRYRLGKTSIVSPISGIVAKQDAKVGEAVTAGTQLVSVISPDYVIDTYVPEVSIAGIRLGNSAAVTLDAYGSEDVFAATVTHIDPAETIRDGVSTYKVKLAFVSPDERVRSGMTANVEIETLRKPAVLLVPERAVLKDNGKAYIFKTVESGKPEKIEVTLGDRDSKGSIELLSELAPGTAVVLNPK